MKCIHKIEDIVAGSFRLTVDRLIYNRYSDKKTVSVSNTDWKKVWITDNKYFSMNFVYEDLICDGSLSIIKEISGKIVFKSPLDLSFTGIFFKEFMLFKQVINENVIWYKFDIKNFELTKLNEELGEYGNVIYFDNEKIISRNNGINCFTYNGEILWKYPVLNPNHLATTSSYNEILFLPIFQQGLYALDTRKGQIVWHNDIAISAFDDINGLIYVLAHDYIVINAMTGEEVVRVNDWRRGQLSEYPALEYFNSNCTLSEDYLIFTSKATFDEFGEGGIFFIDKSTAQVKEYFRIVFDKDPFQRKGWYGNLIPDDKQIPFMPLETPIYKNGRLYVVLPSPIEGQKDLYVYEREE